MAFALCKDGNQHIRTGNLFAVGRLDVNHGALDHALESCRRLGILVIAGDEIVQLTVDIIGHDPFEMLEIDVTGAHHCARILIVDQGKQEVFERRIFVMPLVRDGKRLMQRPFKAGRKRWHMTSLFSITHCNGCWFWRAKSMTANLGFGNFVSEYAALTDTVVMNMQHNTSCVVHILLKNRCRT